MPRSKISSNLRAKFERVGENVLEHALGAGQLSEPHPELAPLLREHRDEISQWIREKRRREKRKGWIGWGIGWFLSLIVIGLAIYNIRLAIRADRPNFVIINARLYVNHLGNPPPELVQINLHNVGRRSALRGTATLFTVSEDGRRHEKFGFTEITVEGVSTTIVPSGDGYARIPLDMEKFLGLFLVCVKYRDERDYSYKQRFLFLQGAPLSDHILTRLDELALSKYPNITCRL